MSWQILYSTEAIADLRRLHVYDRATVLSAISTRLTNQPDVEGGAVKRLRQPAAAEFRLRVGDVRVFYDVERETVYVVRILTKADSLKYLEAQS